MVKKTVLISVIVGLVGASVWAQQRVHGTRILHEFFDARLELESEGAAASQTARPEIPTIPTSVGPDSPPPLSGEVGGNELVWGAEGPAPDSRLSAPNGPLNPFGSSHSLDSRTDRVNSLNYFENFDPSIIPFKRVVSLNRFTRSEAGTYSVELDSGEYREVSVTPSLSGHEEVFWGTFALDSERDRWLPIASVSPDQRILKFVSDPPVPVRFFVDQAGNHYVRTNHRGLLRLNVQVAVATDYFSAEFPAVAWEEFRGMVTPEHPELRPLVDQVIREVGLRGNEDPKTTLITLIEYFRDFEGRPFPESAGGKDMYRAIVEEQVGVCRHRSLAFLVTLRSLGIPVHYVYNEAHAFVEVFWPRLGWRRVDLGGAADELNSASTAHSAVHSPPDNLPQPSRFIEEQQRMAQGAGSGSGSGSEARSNADSDSGSVSGSEVSDGAGDGQTDRAAELAAQDTPTQPVPSRVKSRVNVRANSSTVLRGKPLTVGGYLASTQGLPLGMKEIEIHIAPLGVNTPGPNSLVGKTRTRANGTYEHEIELPSDFAVGRWSLFVHFPGDAEHEPTIGE